MDEYTRISGEATKERYLARSGEDILTTRPETIIEKYIEATGGLDAWSNIQSMKISYTVQPDAGRDIELVQHTGGHDQAFDCVQTENLNRL